MQSPATGGAGRAGRTTRIQRTTRNLAGLPLLRADRSQWVPIALFGVVALVMGVGYVTVRIGVTSAPPLAIATLRFYLTAVVLLGFASTTGRVCRPRTLHDWATIAVLGLFVFAGSIGFLFLGQRDTPASVAAVLMSLGPVLTVLFARVLLPDDRFTRRQSVGVFLGVAGTVAIANPSSDGLASTDGLGVLLVLCAAASGGLGSVLLGRLESSMPLSTLAGWGSLLGGFVLHAASVGTGQSVGLVAWTPTLVLVLAYLSVVVGACGYVVLVHLVRTLGPARTSLTAYASPVVTILVGWAFLHEPVTREVALGLVTIGLGFVFLNGTVGVDHRVGDGSR